ncbi:MAG: hypothetical protein ACOY3P_15395 [Planctomycetota bacterium]
MGKLRGFRYDPPPTAPVPLVEALRKTINESCEMQEVQQLVKTLQADDYARAVELYRLVKTAVAESLKGLAPEELAERARRVEMVKPLLGRWPEVKSRFEAHERRMAEVWERLRSETLSDEERGRLNVEYNTLDSQTCWRRTEYLRHKVAAETCAAAGVQ